MTLTPRGAALSPEEEARCAAMAERAAMHTTEAEGFARQLQNLRAKRPAVVEALSLIVAIHVCERARCAALDVKPPTLEDTLDRYQVLGRAVLNQPLTALQECQH